MYLTETERMSQAKDGFLAKVVQEKDAFWEQVVHAKDAQIEYYRQLPPLRMYRGLKRLVGKS